MIRHSRGRGFTAALATTMTLGLLVVGAPQSPARADEQADIPVLGRVRLTPQKPGVTGEAVLSLHSVNRTARATVVYYSRALAPGSTTRYAGSASAADYVSRVGNGQYTVPTQVAGANDGAVVDGRGEADPIASNDTGLKRTGTGVLLTFWAKGSNPGDAVVMLANDLSTLPHLIDPSTRTKYSADTFTDSAGKTFAVMSEVTSTNTAVPNQVEIRYTVPGSVKSLQLGIDGASGSHQQVAVPPS